MLKQVKDLKMKLLSNNIGERVSIERLSNFALRTERISIVSLEGDCFKVSKFVISFLSDFIDEDHDTILTPITSSKLKYITDVLNISKVITQTQTNDLDDISHLGIDPGSFEVLLKSLDANSVDHKKVDPL